MLFPVVFSVVSTPSSSCPLQTPESIAGIFQLLTMLIKKKEWLLEKDSRGQRNISINWTTTWKTFYPRIDSTSLACYRFYEIRQKQKKGDNTIAHTHTRSFTHTLSLRLTHVYLRCILQALPGILMCAKTSDTAEAGSTLNTRVVGGEATNSTEMTFWQRGGRDAGRKICCSFSVQHLLYGNTQV